MQEKFQLETEEQGEPLIDIDAPHNLLVLSGVAHSLYDNHWLYIDSQVVSPNSYRCFACVII